MENKDLSEILKMIFQKLTKEVTEAYYNGNLDGLLQKYGFEEDTESFAYVDNSKILVIGDSAVGEAILNGVAKTKGIISNMIEYVLDYEKLTNYNFENLHFNMAYSDILVGPMPHSVRGVEGYSSFLAKVRANPSEYPKVIELRDSTGLKITKTSFKEGLEKTRLFNEL